LTQTHDVISETLVRNTSVEFKLRNKTGLAWTVG